MRLFQTNYGKRNKSLDRQATESSRLTKDHRDAHEDRHFAVYFRMLSPAYSSLFNIYPLRQKIWDVNTHDVEQR